MTGTPKLPYFFPSMDTNTTYLVFDDWVAVRTSPLNKLANNSDTSQTVKCRKMYWKSKYQNETMHLCKPNAKKTVLQWSGLADLVSLDTGSLFRYPHFPRKNRIGFSMKGLLWEYLWIFYTFVPFRYIGHLSWCWWVGQTQCEWVLTCSWGEGAGPGSSLCGGGRRHGGRS